MFSVILPSILNKAKSLESSLFDILKKPLIDDVESSNPKQFQVRKKVMQVWRYKVIVSHNSTDITPREDKKEMMVVAEDNLTTNSGEEI